MPFLRFDGDGGVEVPLGPDVLRIDRRYEFVSIANDVLIGLWFLAGSILFFFKPLETAAVSLFVLGSLQYLARSGIRLARLVHLKRRDTSAGPQGTTDF